MLSSSGNSSPDFAPRQMPFDFAPRAASQAGEPADQHGASSGRAQSRISPAKKLLCHLRSATKSVTTPMKRLHPAQPRTPSLASSAKKSMRIANDLQQLLTPKNRRNLSVQRAASSVAGSRTARHPPCDLTSGTASATSAVASSCSDASDLASHCFNSTVLTTTSGSTVVSSISEFDAPRKHDQYQHSLADEPNLHLSLKIDGELAAPSKRAATKEL